MSVAAEAAEAEPAGACDEAAGGDGTGDAAPALVPVDRAGGSSDTPQPAAINAMASALIATSDRHPTPFRRAALDPGSPT